MIRVRRIDHVSLNVTDRTCSIAWYSDVLGLRQQNQPTADAEPVFLGEPGTQLGLFQAQLPAAPHEPESAGLRHVALLVDDLADAQEHLRAHEVAFTYEDHGNAESVYFQDPDGHTVELTTYR